jgi:small subunit ribosomal protein S7
MQRVSLVGKRLDPGTVLRRKPADRRINLGFVTMPRRGPVQKREIQADPLYRSPLVAQFIQKVMRDGKKSIAEKIVYRALELVAQAEKEDPVAVLKRAVDNVRPVLEVRSRRVGGATYQVPVEVAPRRAQTLAVRWIVGNARQRQGKPMFEKLAGEILDASRGVGPSVKRRDDLHKMAEANRAFAHYRW